MTTTPTKKVALVTGASSGIGSHRMRLQEAGFLVYGVARRTDRMAGLRDRGIKTLAMDITDEESTTWCPADPRRNRSHRRSGQQRRIRLLRRRRGRAAGRSAPPVRGKCLRRSPADPACAARHAGARQRHDHQHHVHGRKDLHAARGLVSRHQVRVRSLQRLSPHGDQAFRHRRRRDRTRRDPHRVGRHRRRSPRRDLRSRRLRRAGQRGRRPRSGPRPPPNGPRPRR